MAYDGIVLHNVLFELNNKIIGGRIEKIYQPEKDEIRLHIIKNGEKYQLLLSSNPSQPRIHLSRSKKKNPPQPSMFCMLLRKYLTSGKIIRLSQPGFERILDISIQAKNELGDNVIYRLIIEIMGKHSNVIFINENNKILDSIKRVSSDMSRIRQVMPGLCYVYPPSHNKKNPLVLNREQILDLLLNYPSNDRMLYKAITNIFSGISYPVSREIIFRAGFDVDIPYSQMSDEGFCKIADCAYDIFNQVKKCDFCPTMWIYHDNPVDFSSLNLNINQPMEKFCDDSISHILDKYYSTKELIQKLNQKISNVKKIINKNLERCYKKLGIQLDTLNKVKNRDQLKKKGELLTANIYRINKGLKQIELADYYNNNQPIIIKLKENLTPAQNAQKYFKAYAKAKNSYKIVSQQLKINKVEINYLESQLDNLDKCSSIDDVEEIIYELKKERYIKDKQNKAKRPIVRSQPMHFVSSDKIDIYVGKNNAQNDYLTLKFAGNDDLWLHVKDVPGSHVIIRCKGKDIPDNTLIEAAHLAAYYSRAKNSSNIAVDYTLKKNVKKPKGAKPGMVIYENYRTVFVTPDKEIIDGLDIV